MLDNGPHLSFGTFCPLGRFVPGRFCPWEVLSLGRYVPWDVLSLGRFVLGRFVLGRFVCASITNMYRYIFFIHSFPLHLERILSYKSAHKIRGNFLRKPTYKGCQTFTRHVGRQLFSPVILRILPRLLGIHSEVLSALR